MAGFVELYLDQGATFISTINVSDDVTNQYVNVAGYSVSSQIRRSYYSVNASAAFTCTLGNTALGEIVLSMDSTVTANLKPGRYVFDVLADAGGVSKTRLLEGIITISPRVTV
jgi:hypothetical protein